MICQIRLVQNGESAQLATGSPPPPFTPTYIRAWRVRSGLTLKQLAELVGSTHGSLSKIERGEQKYDQRTVDRIAFALNIHPAQLLWGNPQDDSSIWRIAGEAEALTEAQRRTLLRIIEAMKSERDGAGQG